VHKVPLVLRDLLVRKVHKGIKGHKVSKDHKAQLVHKDQLVFKVL
jgi:hypothetical protein